MELSSPGDEASLEPSGIRPVFLDPSGKRWTRIRWFTVVVTLTLATLGIIFGLSLLRHRTAATTPASGVDLERAAANAINRAAIPPLDQPADAISQRGTMPVWAATAPRLARRFAWVDPGDDDAMASVKHHGTQLTDVVLDGIFLGGGSGEVQGKVPRSAVEVVHAAGARALLSVDAAAEGGLSASEMTTLARTEEGRNSLAAALAETASAVAADGLVITMPDDEVDDFDSDERSALLRAIHDRLAPAQTLAIAAFADFDPHTLRVQSGDVEFVLLRAHRDPDDPVLPGPSAPNDWLDLVIGAAVDAAGSARVVPMLPVRSTAWAMDSAEAVVQGSGMPATWAEVMAKASIAGIRPRWAAAMGSAMVVLPGRDGVLAASGMMLPGPDDGDAQAWLAWIADGASFANGLALSRARGISFVGLDGLGGEDPRIWQVMQVASLGDRAMRDALTEVPPPEPLQIVGDGIEIRARSDVHPGRCRVSLDSSGLVTSERFAELPEQVTVERRAHAPHGQLALTFDDGPDPEFTPQVLDVLDQYGVKATFFLIGTRIERDPEIVQQVVARGHEIGNHSFSHPDFGRIADAKADLEIRATNLLIASTTGRSTLLFRPPFRADDAPHTPEDLAGIESAARNGMTVVASTIDPRDWERPGAASIAERVVTAAEQDGAGVVLLHDGGGDRSQTVQALRTILPTLTQHGFSFVQIHDLLGSPAVDHTNPPVPTLLEVRANQAVWWGGTWLLRALRLLALCSLVLAFVRFAVMMVLASVYAGWERRMRWKREAAGGAAPFAVTVVIPAFNEERVIVRTIQSVLSSLHVTLEVLVMDDGSVDDTGGVVARAFGDDPRVKYVRLANGGKARALNLGFRRASNEIVVALDADTLFLPETIVRLVATMDEPRIAAVAGRAVVGNVRGFVGRCQAMEYVCGQAIERRAWAALGVVSVVPGAVGAWRRDAVLAAGGFARDTLAEDSDLTLALQLQGWRIAYASRAVALTEAPETLQALLKQRFRWTFGVLQMMWKQRQALSPWSAAPPTVRWLLLPTILSCHFGLPLLAPAVDLAGALAVYLGYGRELVPYAIAMLGTEFQLALAAMLVDRAPVKIAWDWVLQRAIYRWILLFALTRAALAALRGGAVGWNKLVRTGTVRATKVTA